MIIFIKNYLFTILVFANVIGYGYFLNLFLNLKEKNFSLLYLNGSILIALISISINFFSPLNIILTNLLFLFFTIFGLLKIYKHIFSY